MLREVLRKTPARKQPQPATLEPAKLPWPEVRPPPRLTPERHAPRKRSEENGRTGRQHGGTTGRRAGGEPGTLSTPALLLPGRTAETHIPLQTGKCLRRRSPEASPAPELRFVCPPSRRSQPDTRLSRPSAPIPPTASPDRQPRPPLPSPLQLPIGHPAAEAKRNGNPNRTQQIGLTRPRIRPFQTAEKPRPRPHSGDSPRCKELRTEFGIS